MYKIIILLKWLKDFKILIFFFIEGKMKKIIGVLFWISIYRKLFLFE